MVKNSPANTEDMGLIPALGRSQMQQLKPMHHKYWACPLEPKSHNY